MAQQQPAIGTDALSGIPLPTMDDDDGDLAGFAQMTPESRPAPAVVSDLEPGDLRFAPPPAGKRDPWSGRRQPKLSAAPDASGAAPQPVDAPPTNPFETINDETRLATVDEEPAAATAAEAPARGGGWTIPMLCAGMAIIAACLLLPLAEENHQLAYQREKLKAELQQIRKQVAVNDEFLRRIATDPGLAERLAQRQMRTIRQGSAVLDLPGVATTAGGQVEENSPFLLVTVPPPPAMPPYRPLGGMLSALTQDPRLRLYFMGGGLFLVMFGLVMSYSKPAGQ